MFRRPDHPLKTSFGPRLNLVVDPCYTVQILFTFTLFTNTGVKQAIILVSDGVQQLKYSYVSVTDVKRLA
jgi:hypothetical protein